MGLVKEVGEDRRPMLLERAYDPVREKTEREEVNSDVTVGSLQPHMLEKLLHKMDTHRHTAWEKRVNGRTGKEPRPRENRPGL